MHHSIVIIIQDHKRNAQASGATSCQTVALQPTTILHMSSVHHTGSLCSQMTMNPSPFLAITQRKGLMYCACTVAYPVQWYTLYSGIPCTVAYPVQWHTLYSSVPVQWHTCTVAYPVQWHTLYSGIPCTVAYPVQWRTCTVAYPVQWHTLYSGIPCTVAYPVQWHTLYSGVPVQWHTLYSGTPVQWHTLYSGIPCTVAYSDVSKACAVTKTNCPKESLYFTIV